MGILIRRPNPSASSGDTNLNRTRLSDGDDGTLRNRSSSIPYIWSYDAFNQTNDIPPGSQVVALRTAQRIRQSGSYQGWPESFLRRNGTRVNGTRLFDPSITSANLYTQRGPALYKGGLNAWNETEVNEFGSDTVRFSHAGKSWYSIADAWMEVIWSEALTDPTLPFPADSETISTSTVNFSTQLPAPQPEQLVRGVFQVASNSGFTTNVSTFHGMWHGNTSPTARASYQAVKGQSSDTNLAPGVWFLRVRSQDFIGNQSDWSATTSFTVEHAPLPEPSLTSPPPGSSVPTPFGVRAAAISETPSDGRAVGVEWNFSQQSNFSSGIVAWSNLTVGLLSAPGEIVYQSEPEAGVAPGLNGTKVSPDDPSQYLTQGVWFGRVRTVDKWGQFSTWSDPEPFTVDHKPRAQGVTPTSHQVIDQQKTPVKWQFSDPWSGDSQTAFRVRVFDDGDALIYDSTKTSSTALQHVLNLDSAYLYNTLRMTVALFDQDDATPTSLASHFFVFSDSPNVVSLLPAPDEAIGTGQPTFAWESGISRPGVTQKNYRIRVFNAETEALVYDTGTIAGTAQTHTPDQVIFRNNRNYFMLLRVEDTDSLSTEITVNFSTSYQAPAEPDLTVNEGTHSSEGYVLLDWSATPPDDFFVTWVVYRKSAASPTWQRIAEIADSSVSSFRDWLVPANGDYQWSVTQVAERSGARIESGVNEDAPVFHTRAERYWVIMPDAAFYHMNLPVDAYSDDFQVQTEKSEYHILNRGRKVNYGTYLGISGSLRARIRPRASLNASEQRARLRAITESFTGVWLKDPFGSVTLVALGDVSYSRVAGVGSSEFVDAEIPYTEVTF